MTLRIGLVSDTHIPMRCRELPPALFSALEGVDLLLHAGDVGTLSVLNNLSEIAPVIAVHGNDDSEESRRSLPYRTVIVADGIRILLWHSHYENRQEEFTSRQGDAFLPKFQRITQVAEEVDASVAVFGHWHIPLQRELNGVTIVNPGAVASGNEITRQLRQTVALLEVDSGVVSSVKHVDLSEPASVYDPTIDWEAGFTATLNRYSTSILSSELQERLPALLSKISEEEQAMLQPLVLRLAHRCWNGEFALIDSELFRKEVVLEPLLSSQDKERFARLLD